MSSFSVFASFHKTFNFFDGTLNVLPLYKCTSLFSLHLPFRPILLLSAPAFSVCCGPSVCCVFVFSVWEREAETETDSMRDGRAVPLWWSRGKEVFKPLLTEAKWCHTVLLPAHLSAMLASTQVIKVSCPSCEIKGHITEGKSGYVLNQIYCSCIIGSLFLPPLAAERKMAPNQEKQQ